jgi:tetratricopeptide (TPR) repeat protein
MSFAQEGGETSEEEENKAEFKRLTTEASAAYEQGDYARAVELFEKAYELRDVSNILYNIARIHEEAGNIDEAIAYYDQFVVAPGIKQKARKDALDRLKTLREVRAMREGEPEDEPEQETETASTTPPTKEPAEPVVTAETSTEQSGARTAGWVLLGVGGASLIGSGVFGLLTQQQYDNFDTATSLEARRDAARAGKTTGIVADSLLITGAVSAIVGGILLLSSATGGDNQQTASTSSRDWAVTPLIGSRAVGVGVTIDIQ